MFNLINQSKNKKIILLFFLFLFFLSLPFVLQAAEKKIIEFTPQISVPGFKAGPIQEGTLADYISKIYKWSVIAIAVLAVVMIMISGISWIFAAGNPTAIKSAQDRFTAALIGLVLILICVPLLGLINPALVRLSSFKIPEIERREETTAQAICISSDFIGLGSSSVPGYENAKNEAVAKCKEDCGPNNYLTLALSDEPGQAGYMRGCCNCKNGCFMGKNEVPVEKEKTCEDSCKKYIPEGAQYQSSEKVRDTCCKCNFTFTSLKAACLAEKIPNIQNCEEHDPREKCCYFYPGLFGGGKCKWRILSSECENR